jgi:hypothetical protein
MPQKYIKGGGREKTELRLKNGMFQGIDTKKGRLLALSNRLLSVSKIVAYALEVFR